MSEIPTSNPVDVAMVRELKRLSGEHKGYLSDMLGNAALRLEYLMHFDGITGPGPETANELLRLRAIDGQMRALLLSVLETTAVRDCHCSTCRDARLSFEAIEALRSPPKTPAEGQS